MIQINGVAHTIITVSDWDQCVAFYGQLLPYLGMQQVFAGKDFVYFVGGRTALGISRCDPEFEHERFDQNRVGLHHHCFRGRSRDDIDSVYRHLQTIDATIIHPPEEGRWAPGYYSVLFEDPVGTRLELNYVPGQGLLAPGANFDPSQGYQ